MGVRRMLERRAKRKAEKEQRAHDNLMRLLQESADSMRELMDTEKKRKVREHEQYLKVEEREKEITARLKESLDLHLKACPWCGEEPTIEAEIIPDYKPYGPFSCEDWSDPKEYRINLKTCEHLDCSGSHWGTYPIDEIPDVLYCNPDYKDYRCDVSWNGGRHPNGRMDDDIPFELFPLTFVPYAELSEEGKKREKDWCGAYRDKSGRIHYDISRWCYAVNDYLKYLSDDYEPKCCVCHKKWRGYELYGEDIQVDGRRYCKACSQAYPDPVNKPRMPRSDWIWRSSMGSTMSDGAEDYFTDFDNFLRVEGYTEDRVFTRYIEDTRTGYGCDALSGDIKGSRWQIYRKGKDDKDTWLLGWVFNPPEKDIERYKRLERKRE